MFLVAFCAALTAAAAQCPHGADSVDRLEDNRCPEGSEGHGIACCGICPDGQLPRGRPQMSSAGIGLCANGSKYFKGFCCWNSEKEQAKRRLKRQQRYDPVHSDPSIGVPHPLPPWLRDPFDDGRVDY
ncbi:hypothetical protein AAVH_17526 [Aphelenchoides avenae]|nr:hypothetical protein AAVH_17526 [Aphelenchus avenae]